MNQQDLKAALKELAQEEPEFMLELLSDAVGSLVQNNLVVQQEHNSIASYWDGCQFSG